MYFIKKKFRFVDEDLLNEVASRPKTLQPYVMETTEVKENLEMKKKVSYLPGKYLRSSCVPLHKSLFSVFSALF